MKNYPLPRYFADNIPFDSLLGETIVEIVNTDETLDIETLSGRRFHMYHCQDCCENVTIEDITGDLQDLLGAEILLAEAVASEEHPEGHEASEWEESFTWTYYKLATYKANVTIRWYGSSNGYYSESVDFVELFPEEDESGV